MDIFAVALSAQNTQDGEDALRVISTFDIDRKAAEKNTLKDFKQDYPTEKGWVNHRSIAQEVPDRQIQKYLNQ